MLLENNFEIQILSGKICIVALKTKEFGVEGKKFHLLVGRIKMKEIRV